MTSIGESSPNVQKSENGEVALLVLISIVVSGVISETMSGNTSESGSDIAGVEEAASPNVRKDES